MSVSASSYFRFVAIIRIKRPEANVQDAKMRTFYKKIQQHYFIMYSDYFSLKVALTVVPTTERQITDLYSSICCNMFLW